MILYDHMLWDPINVLITDLQFPLFVCISKVMDSLAWPVDGAKASKRKEQKRPRSQAPLGRELEAQQQWPRPPGGITGHSGCSFSREAQILEAHTGLLHRRANPFPKGSARNPWAQCLWGHHSISLTPTLSPVWPGGGMPGRVSQGKMIQGRIVFLALA